MESDVRTQVVSTGPTLIATTARLARFDRHAFAHSRRGDSLADFNYLTGRFVSQDQRAADHEFADAAVLVIVDIGSANSDRENPDQYLTFRRSWNRTLLNSQIARRVKDRCRHRAARLTGIAGRPRCRHSGLLAGAHRSPRGGFEGTEFGLYYVTRSKMFGGPAPLTAVYLFHCDCFQQSRGRGGRFRGKAPWS
jgi:hypothetical protein